jgi:hypothetical protein|tara:strand:- start:330 stop:899 length:570 start_codon:yes stop_codon:yes gene_type:complete
MGCLFLFKDMDTSIKHLIKKIDFLEEEQEAYEEAFPKYLKKFIEDFPEHKEKILAMMNGEKKDTEEKTDTSDLSPVEKKALKKLYHKISRLSHPDVIQSAFLNNIFQKAASAYESESIDEIVRLCVLLEIDFGSLKIERVKEKLEDSASTYEEKIASYQNSLPYLWSKAKTDDEKQQAEIMIMMSLGLS